MHHSKTHRTACQSVDIHWFDRKCGDGHRYHRNHCGCLRRRHHRMAFRGSRSTYIAGAGRFPGRFDREADHGRHSVRRFLDSTLDRIADWALLAGVIVFFILHADWWYDISQSSPDYISWVGVGAAMVSMMTSFVTSYARARAESVGFEVKNGIATRADRLVIIWWAWRSLG